MADELVFAGHDEVHLVPTLGQRVPELDGIVEKAPVGGGLDYRDAGRTGRHCLLLLSAGTV
jgi:hypothetical protein